MRYGLLLPLVLLSFAKGGVHLRVIAGRPVVDGVYVNGHGPYRFLVDTGTSMNHLEPGLAAEAGLRATFRTELASSLGSIVVPGIDGITVELGGLQADRQRFLFGGIDALHGLSDGIQGVLGQAFLSQFDYLIDLRGKRLSFGKQEAKGSRAQFQAVNGRTVVATNLGNLVLDSGAARLVLFGIEALIDGQSLMRTMAGSSLVGLVPRRLTIEGRHVWKGQAVAIQKQEQPGVAGLMPIHLFRAVYVCNSEGYLVFE